MQDADDRNLDKSVIHKREKSPKKVAKLPVDSSVDSPNLEANLVGTSEPEKRKVLGNGVVKKDEHESFNHNNGACTVPKIEINSESITSCSANKESTGVVMRKSGTGELSTANHIHRSSTIVTNDIGEDGRGNIRISKSDTSLSESFVLISESDINEAEKATDIPIPVRRHPKPLFNKLRDGNFRQILFIVSSQDFIP